MSDRAARGRLSLLRAAQHLRDAVGAPLVAEGALDAVPAIPGAMTTGWGCVVFETRLSGADPRVDVMGALARPALLDDWPRGAPTAGHADWRQHPLVRAWARPRLADVPLLWFEWDVEGHTTRDPLVFVCVSDSILGAEHPPGADRPWRALAAALPDRPTDVWRARLERLLDALGDDGELLHIAWLGPRECRRLRVVFHVAARSVCSWLAAVGWPGSTAGLSAALFRVTNPFRRMGVQLELEPELGAYLGLEIPEFADEPDAHSRFARTLEQVATLTRVDPARAERLARWPGPALLDGARGPLAVLRHGYVKLVREGDGWQAKGYLALTPIGAPGTSHAPIGRAPPPRGSACAR
jgi:hypothetical protein